ncbi:MAG: hypothetical protein QF416_08370 [Candidatus Marinimicrobia bacterium]|nr:hypothetical protein [Candidatus Neomarinimicrobiota bacterium]
MGLLSVLPNRWGISREKKPSHKTQGILLYTGLFVLIALIPLRHIFHNGFIEASLMLTVGLAAFISGMAYEGKAGFCVGLCPLLHVEKLYGMKPLTSFENILCKQCSHCVAPCPDLMKNDGFSNFAKFKIMERVIVGGFPGFVWGWFQVPDYTNPIEWGNILYAYIVPLSGLVLSIIIYELLRKVVEAENFITIQLTFSFIAITVYYWYRLPEIFIVNTTDQLLLFALRGATITFFGWWFLLRTNKKRAWQYLVNQN